MPPHRLVHPLAIAKTPMTDMVGAAAEGQAIERES